MYKGRLELPYKSVYVPSILTEHHVSVVGGSVRHFENVEEDPVRVLLAEYAWRCFHKFVASCDVCQRQKYSTLSPAGLLQPFPIPQSI